jgi:uncharacterized membrane protein
MKYLFLGIGILSIVSAYGLFNGDQYFSELHMLLLMALVFSSIVLMMLSYTIDGNSKRGLRDPRILLACIASVVSVAIILIELEFAVFSEPISQIAVLTVIGSVALALATSSAAYLISYVLMRKKGPKFYVLAIICIIAASMIIGEARFLISPELTSIGTDELSFDYYAANFFLTGKNPYSSNFSSVIAETGVWPTTYLNGTCQCYYVYPPLAFGSLVPFAIAIHDYSMFLQVVLTIVTAILLLTFTALFRNSNNSTLLIVPLFGIAFAVYLISQWAVVKSIAMALILFAYMLRKRPFAYPLLLGVAASLHELVWIIIPFFIVMTLKEEGVKKTLKVSAIIGAVFLAAISYFLLTSPGDFVRGLSSNNAWIEPMGITFMQFFISFYPVAYNSIIAFPFLIYGLMLVVFAFYDRYRSMMCIAATITFAFWAYSSISYTIVFMPLLAYLISEQLYSEKEHEARWRHEKSSMKIKYLIASVVALAILFVAMVVFGNYLYEGVSPPLKFNAIVPVLTNGTNGTVTLQSIELLARSELTNDSRATLMFVSMKPNFVKDSFLTNLNKTYNDTFTFFDFPASLRNVTNATRVKIIVSFGHRINAIDVPLNISKKAK